MLLNSAVKELTFIIWTENRRWRNNGFTFELDECRDSARDPKGMLVQGKDRLGICCS